jgi:hypothetical protein
MIVSYKVDSITLTPEMSEKEVIAWMFLNVQEGENLLKFHIEEFIKHRGANKEAQDKEALWERYKNGEVVVTDKG